MDSIPKSKKEMKQLKKIGRDIGTVTVLILAIVILFTTQGILQQVNYTKEVTGDAIRVGKGEPPQQVIVQPPKQQQTIVQPKKQNPTPNKNIQCWNNAGISRTDITIIGNLLQMAFCEEPTEKKEVKATIENQCIIFDTAGQIQTNICVEDIVPTVDLQLPTQGKGTVLAPIIKRNHLPLILFVLILIFTFSIWSWDEMRTTLQPGRGPKSYDELELSYGIARIPDYTHLKKIKDKENVTTKMEKIYHTLIKTQKKLPNKKVLTEKQTANMIQTFNTQTTQLSKSIQRNDISDVERKYKELFSTFNKLYNNVQEKQQQTLLKVMLYFSKQTTLLKKSKKIGHLIREAYQDTGKHKL